MRKTTDRKRLYKLAEAVADMDTACITPVGAADTHQGITRNERCGACPQCRINKILGEMEEEEPIQKAIDVAVQAFDNLIHPPVGCTGKEDRLINDARDALRLLGPLASWNKEKSS